MKLLSSLSSLIRCHISIINAHETLMKPQWDWPNLLHGTAQLPSDQVMLSDPAAEATTAPIVHRFAGNQQDFFRNFATSMVKMGNISPLTGTDGKIRKNCRKTNSKRYWKLLFNLIDWPIAMYV
jgi:hypothetical protein